MNFFKKNLWIIVILLVNLVVVLYPTLSTSLPITQTDGLTYYGISKTLATTGDFTAELPDYITHKGEEGSYVNEFLPIPTLYIAAFIKLFGERIAINGGALGFLFVFANLFLYLLVEKLTDKKTALIVTLFSALNFRFYFLLWGGNWANVCAMMLSVPALYYYVEFLDRKKISLFLLSAVFLLLTAGSHTMHFLYIVFMMIGLWFGVKVLANTKIKLPEIKFSFGKAEKKTLSTVIYTLIIAAVAFLVTFIPFVLSGTRTKWIDEWIAHLMQFDKVPEFWHYGIISDGPILLVFALLGLLLALYKQNWKLLGLVVPSYIIVNLTNFLVPEDIWLSLFVYRFQAFHFIILAILAIYFAFSVIKSNKACKKIMITLITLSLVWQTAKVGALMYEVEPAITEDEKAAAEYMAELDEDFWLVANVNTWSSFRSYEWIMAYGDTHAANHSEDLGDEAIKAQYLMIQDTEALSNGQKNSLKTRDLIFEQGLVTIYK